MARGKFDLRIEWDGDLTVPLSRRIRKDVVNKIVELTDATWSEHRLRFEGTAADVGIIKEILVQEYPDWAYTERDERPRIRREGDRVAWSHVTAGIRSGLTGFVNGRKLFQVESNYTRKDGTLHYLTTTLPGFDARDGVSGYAYAAKGRDQGAVQDAAEDVVREFLSRLGAVFADEREG